MRLELPEAYKNFVPLDVCQTNTALDGESSCPIRGGEGGTDLAEEGWEGAIGASGSA